MVSTRSSKNNDGLKKEIKTENFNQLSSSFNNSTLTLSDNKIKLEKSEEEELDEEYIEKVNNRKKINLNNKKRVNNILNHFIPIKRLNNQTKSIIILDEALEKLSKQFNSLGHEEKYHELNKEEIDKFKEKLLNWYDDNKRELPWRVNKIKQDNNNIKIDKEKEEENDNLNAYKVWVSEIMLQQTQVNTVISYFNKWMKEFPTIKHLAKAELDHVNKLWSGLGYYQRAKRLHEGAKLVIEKFNGIIPNTKDGLLKLPGIGPYTAGAIASIAFNLPHETVDGNVMRVLTRILAISGDIRVQGTISKLWSSAKLLVCHNRPGDFNQAYMDFGSKICTSTNPQCLICPMAQSEKPICKAFIESKVKLSDIKDIEELYNLNSKESICSTCTDQELDSKNPFSVTRYPYKSPLKKARDEECVVLVMSKIKDGIEQYYMTKRPDKGLLAGMWAFPTFELTTTTNSTKKINNNLLNHQKALQTLIINPTKMNNIKSCGSVFHKFSHIAQTYHIYKVQLSNDDDNNNDNDDNNDDNLKIENEGVWCIDPKLNSLPTAYAKIWQKV